MEIALPFAMTGLVIQRTLIDPVDDELKFIWRDGVAAVWHLAFDD